MPLVSRAVFFSTCLARLGGSLYEKPIWIRSAWIGVGLVKLRITSLLINLWGITTISRSRVSSRTARQLISITWPTTPLTSSQSPTVNGRSNSSAIPDITLPRVSCRARPITIELTPRAVTRPARSAFHTVASTKAVPSRIRNSRARSISSLGTRARQVSASACSNRITLSKDRAAWITHTQNTVSTVLNRRLPVSSSSRCCKNTNSTSIGSSTSRTSLTGPAMVSFRRCRRWISSPNRIVSSGKPMARPMPQIQMGAPVFIEAPAARWPHPPWRR